MKPNLVTRLLTAAGLAATLLASDAGAALPKKSPGLADLSIVAEADSNSGRSVEVNLTPPLLSLAARLAAEQEPELSRIIAGLKSVRVHVVGMDKTNLTNVTDRVAKLRASLQADGWDQIARVRENGADIVVHFKTRGEEAVEGVVVSILDGRKEAVVVNVVGDVKPGDLARLGSKLKIDPLLKAGEVMQGNDSVKPQEQ